MPEINLTTIIKAERNIVFDLSCSIDLHKISTVQTNEQAVSGVTSGLIGLNESVTWRARHFGIYQTLTTKITKFNRPQFFVDEMVQGVFKRFTHEHHFKEVINGTEMVDIFDYESPLGVLGKMADKLFLFNYMELLLKKRNLIIKHYAESGKWKEII